MTSSSLLSVCSLLLVALYCLLQSASAQTTASISYTLNSANTLYGIWSTCFRATMTVTPYTLPSGYTYTGASSALYDTVYTINSVTSAQRTFTNAVGSAFQSTANSGLLAANYTYAPSGLTASLGNDNLLFVQTSSGNWTTSAGGIGLTITTTSGAAGSPGLPGFPKTARFNQAIILQISSLAGGALRESGYGPLVIDNNIGAASKYTPTYTGTGFATPMTATAFSLTGTQPACAAIGTALFMQQSFCYILYPHEINQNGNWSIVASGFMYTSQQPIASGSRMAYVLYGLNSVTRTYIDQYGQVNRGTGAVLQGPGGDGGTDNLLFTTTDSTSNYGGMVDGGGFTYTMYNGSYYGVLTPGDPTLSYAMNFYYETNYREAAEPWHEDEEYAAQGISSFTFSQGPATTLPTCVAGTFPLTTKPANLNNAVVYNFCSYIASAAAGAWSITTSGTLSVTTTVFTSFATTDSVFYQIGTAITGQRVYASAGNSAQTVQITGLLSPGGDGQNNNKLYNGSNATPFDDGGWSYTTSSTPQLPGVTASGTFIVRLYNLNGNWTEQALPSFQTISASNSSSSYFKYQLASAGAVSCGSNSNGGNGNAAAPRAGAAAAVVLAGAAAVGVAMLW